MKIKIYQIDRERCNDDCLFENYDSVMNRYNKIDPSIYKTVYDGESYMSDLEGVYAQFNTERPPVFRGRSMSVSDVVEICDNTDRDSKGIYFCDRIGFKKLKDFDTSKIAPLSGKRMLVVEPHRPPYEAIVPDDLESLQHAVDGYIEVTYPFEDNTVIISNEEGKIVGMEGNRRIGGDIYAGQFLISADDGNGGFCDLTDEQVSTYKQRFSQDEIFTPEEVEESAGMYFVGF